MKVHSSHIENLMETVSKLEDTLSMNYHGATGTLTLRAMHPEPGDPTVKVKFSVSKDDGFQIVDVTEVK